MLHLPTVTLLCVDCVDIVRAGIAVDHSTNLVTFGDVRFLTSLPTARGDVLAIPPITSLDNYSVFMLRNSYQYVDTPHMLVVQHDGYVIDAGAWSDEFLDYDYIGALWLDGTVGNGGFSLRSHNLMTCVANLLERGASTRHTNEDEIICRDLRPQLEALGYRFAPANVAARFSFELTDRPASTFGFHQRKAA